MTNKEMAELGSTYVMQTYARFGKCLTEGKGCRIKDVEGNWYLDFIGGIAVMSLGHGYEKVVNAIKAQSEKLMQCSNLFWIEPQIKLAQVLVDHSFADKAFFCNSGAEANEAAIKLARKHSYEKYGENKFTIITMKNSFHGRTLATVTATGQEKYQKGFYPLVEGFKYVPFNDLKALESAMDESICAIMIEPLQGEGGVTSAEQEYLEKARALCSKYDALLIYDEVQCGLGRTGKLFAYEHYGVAPDIMTLSKSLGGGLPIGCCLATGDSANAFKPGDHASTFGGNPLSAAAGYAAVTALLDDGIVENAEKMGAYLKEGLEGLKGKHDIIRDVRGKGLLVGMELDTEVAPYVQKCHDKGLLICSAGAKVMRFVPPLVISKTDIDEALVILGEVLGGV